MKLKFLTNTMNAGRVYAKDEVAEVRDAALAKTLLEGGLAEEAEEAGGSDRATARTQLEAKTVPELREIIAKYPDGTVATLAPNAKKGELIEAIMAAYDSATAAPKA